MYGSRDIHEDPALSQDALQEAINAILHDRTPTLAELKAVKRLQWLYWRLEDIRVAQPEPPMADVIPFLRPVVAKVCQLDPSAWPNGAA